jgi:hypothetical protein
MRRFGLPAALLACALILAAVAAVDHDWKKRRSNHAQVGEWYCAHQGTRCGGPSSAAIERHWNERELVYEIFGAALLAAAATVAVHRLDRGRLRT